MAIYTERDDGSSRTRASDTRTLTGKKAFERTADKPVALPVIPVAPDVGG